MLVDRIASSESLLRRVVAESANSAAPLWVNRGELLAKRQLWTESAAAFGEAVRLLPENLNYRHLQILALVAAGDHTGLRRTQTNLLDRFRMTTDPGTANFVAWYSAMAAGEEPDLSEAVRLAELAVNKAASGTSGASLLNTLGAVLCAGGHRSCEPS